MRIIKGWGLLVALVGSVIAAELPTVRFLDQTFTLAWVDAKPAFTLNEYVLPGEKVEGWTQLLTIAKAPTVPSPAVVVDSVIKSSLARGLLVAKPQVMKRDAKQDDDLVVFLIMKDPASGQLEFNLQRYVKEPGEPGVRNYQYARHYAVTAEKPKTDEVNAWLKALWAVRAPVHAAMPR